MTLPTGLSIRRVPTLAPTEYTHPLIFKRSELGHDGVVRYYFEQFVRASEW